jgi:hypothetical protein
MHHVQFHERLGFFLCFNATIVTIPKKKLHRNDTLFSVGICPTASDRHEGCTYETSPEIPRGFNISIFHRYSICLQMVFCLLFGLEQTGVINMARSAGSVALTGLITAAAL